MGFSVRWLLRHGGVIEMAAPGHADESPVVVASKWVVCMSRCGVVVVDPGCTCFYG